MSIFICMISIFTRQQSMKLSFQNLEDVSSSSIHVRSKGNMWQLWVFLGIPQSPGLESCWTRNLPQKKPMTIQYLQVTLKRKLMAFRKPSKMGHLEEDSEVGHYFQILTVKGYKSGDGAHILPGKIANNPTEILGLSSFWQLPLQGPLLSFLASAWAMLPLLSAQHARQYKRRDVGIEALRFSVGKNK